MVFVDSQQGSSVRLTLRYGTVMVAEGFFDSYHHSRVLGMVQAWVAQKLLKRNILRLLMLSDLINI